MNFPLLYHTHYSYHLEDLPFWLGMADKQGDPVLELGCGTGRVLLPLVRAGHRTFGLDNDFSMLSFLKSKWMSEIYHGFSHLPPVFQADLRNFHLSGLFPLIIMPCNTWSTLEPAERQNALKQIYAHLASNGLFVVSIPNPQLLRDLPPKSVAEFEESFDHPFSGNPVQVSSSWKRDKTHFTVYWYYDHLLPDGIVERLVVNAAHHLSTVGDYLDELRNTGLKIRTIWGDFDDSAYLPDSPNLILSASKY